MRLHFLAGSVWLLAAGALWAGEFALVTEARPTPARHVEAGRETRLEIIVSKSTSEPVTLQPALFVSAAAGKSAVETRPAPAPIQVEGEGPQVKSEVIFTAPEVRAVADGLLVFRRAEGGGVEKAGGVLRLKIHPADTLTELAEKLKDRQFSAPGLPAKQVELLRALGLKIEDAPADGAVLLTEKLPDDFPVGRSFIEFSREEGAPGLVRIAPGGGRRVKLPATLLQNLGPDFDSQYLLLDAIVAALSDP